MTIKGKTLDGDNIKLSLKGLWAIIVAVFLFGGATVGYQMRVDAKIEQMYLQSTQQHTQVMIKLNEIYSREQFYVLKRQVEDALLFVAKERDSINNHTNSLVHDEIEFRARLREFLK
jgi:hypothetical protein